MTETNSPYYAAAPAAPLATKRPATVTAAIVIISIGAVLGFILGLVLIGTLSGVPSGTEGLVAAQLVVALLIVVSVIDIVSVIFIAKGYGVARFGPAIFGGILVIVDLVSGTPAFGDALHVVAIVLLFLPASNAWFRAKAAVRNGTAPAVAAAPAVATAPVAPTAATAPVAPTVAPVDPTAPPVV